jgi:hypothetical protein
MLEDARCTTQSFFFFPLSHIWSGFLKHHGRLDKRYVEFCSTRVIGQSGQTVLCCEAEKREIKLWLIMDARANGRCSQVFFFFSLIIPNLNFVIKNMNEQVVFTKMHRRDSPVPKRTAVHDLPRRSFQFKMRFLDVETCPNRQHY